MSDDRFKFRAWNKVEHMYHYNAECAYDFMGGTPPLMANSFDDVLCNDKYVVEQCTGFADKNGKLIFDGDVIQENGINRYIHWHDGGWCYSIRHYSKCHWRLRKEDVENAEIIGNVHEMEVEKCS